MKNYQIKDIRLADAGFRQIELAEGRMGALMEVRKRFSKARPLKGLRVAMALHVTKETAVLVRTLRSAGAEVYIAGCNPLSTQDDVAAALAKEGAYVFAHKGESARDYYQFLRYVIESRPHITIDDGCDLVSLIHKSYPKLLAGVIGGCEETTTGLIRLRSMERDGALKYPIIAVNDNKTKHLMDNYYGTGQSTIDGVMRACNFMFAGKTVVIAGYGSCGKGVALRARGMGASVIVTEVKPFPALQAVMDGYEVMTMREAARIGDLFITVSGNRDVITAAHVRLMKDGAILANSGHFDVEIDVTGIAKAARAVRRMRPFMDEYVFGREAGRAGDGGGTSGKRIFILSEGRLVNLAAAEGHPSEVMSLSFCGQALACEYLVKQRGKLKAGVHMLPEKIDNEIAELQLKVVGVGIDKLTPEQRKYLESWEVGT